MKRPTATGVSSRVLGPQRACNGGGVVRGCRFSFGGYASIVFIARYRRAGCQCKCTCTIWHFTCTKACQTHHRWTGQGQTSKTTRCSGVPPILGCSGLGARRCTSAPLLEATQPEPRKTAADKPRHLRSIDGLLGECSSILLGRGEDFLIVIHI